MFGVSAFSTAAFGATPAAGGGGGGGGGESTSRVKLSFPLSGSLSSSPSFVLSARDELAVLRGKIRIVAAFVAAVIFARARRAFALHGLPA